MLNPEIWNFKTPQHYFSIEEKDFKKTDIPNIIKSHYFNHSVCKELIFNNFNFMKIML